MASLNSAGKQVMVSDLLIDSDEGRKQPAHVFNKPRALIAMPRL